MHSQNGSKTSERRLFSLGVDDSLEQSVPGLSSWLMSDLGSAVASGFLCYPFVCPSGYPRVHVGAQWSSPVSSQALGPGC